MNPRKAYLLVLSVLCIQMLDAQNRQLPKPGFEQRIANAENAIRLIDTHEHLMSEKEALTNPADFSCLFTNYQQSDLISSGMLPEKVYNILKGKEARLDEKWAAVKEGWENMRTTAYGRSVRY